MSAALFRATVLGLASVFLAHALSYVLLTGLPEAAIILLGLSGGQEAVVEVVRKQFSLPPYHQILLQLSSGHLGTTLDGTPVSTELVSEIIQSLPRLAIATAIAISCAVTSALFASDRHRIRVKPILGFLTFIPPYLPAFAVFALLISFGIGIEPRVGSLAWWGSILASAVVPSAFLAMQTSNMMLDHVRRPYATLQRAMGATPMELRRILLHNVVAESMPSLEKAVTWLLANLLFAELVLGLPGLGSMAARALRRSDPYLILAVILTFALLINSIRVGSVAVRRLYGIKGV